MASFKFCGVFYAGGGAKQYNFSSEEVGFVNENCREDHDNGVEDGDHLEQPWPVNSLGDVSADDGPMAAPR